MQTTILTDEQLIQQFVAGSDSAFETLMNRHKQKVFTTIYMFVRDRYLAEDLFQEVFIKVINHLRGGFYVENGKFLPWVMRIANNKCIDWYRKMKIRPKVTTTDGKDIFEWLRIENGSADFNIIRHQSHSALRNLIDQLPAEQKEVLILRQYSGLSFNEIAEVTNTCLNTSLGRMRYALLNLRKMYEAKAVVL